MKDSHLTSYCLATIAAHLTGKKTEDIIAECKAYWKEEDPIVRPPDNKAKNKDEIAASDIKLIYNLYPKTDPVTKRSITKGGEAKELIRNLCECYGVEKVRQKVAEYVDEHLSSGFYPDFIRALKNIDFEDSAGEEFMVRLDQGAYR